MMSSNNGSLIPLKLGYLCEEVGQDKKPQDAEFEKVVAFLIRSLRSCTALFFGASFSPAHTHA